MWFRRVGKGVADITKRRVESELQYWDSKMRTTLLCTLSLANNPSFKLLSGIQ